MMLFGVMLTFDFIMTTLRCKQEYSQRHRDFAPQARRL